MAADLQKIAIYRHKPHCLASELKHACDA